MSIVDRCGSNLFHMGNGISDDMDNKSSSINFHETTTRNTEKHMRHEAVTTRMLLHIDVVQFRITLPFQCLAQLVQSMEIRFVDDTDLQPKVHRILNEDAMYERMNDYSVSIRCN
jgi:hypothetical protein